MKLTLASSQVKLVAEFFSNMAVVWFAAAFVAPVSQLTVAKSLVNGFLALLIGIVLIKEVKV